MNMGGTCKLHTERAQDLCGGELHLTCCLLRYGWAGRIKPRSPCNEDRPQHRSVMKSVEEESRLKVKVTRVSDG